MEYDLLVPVNRNLVIKVLFPIQYQEIRNAQNALRDGIIIIEQDRNRYAVDRYGNQIPQREWY